MATTVQLKMTPSIRATRRTSVNEQFATLLSNTLPEKLLLLQPREISCSVVSFLVFHVITLLLNFPEGTRTIFLRTGPPDSRFVAVGTWQLAPKISRAKNISPAGCSEDTRRKYLSSTGPAACASLTVSLARVGTSGQGDCRAVPPPLLGRAFQFNSAAAKSGRSRSNGHRRGEAGGAAAADNGGGRVRVRGLGGEGGRGGPPRGRGGAGDGVGAAALGAPCRGRRRRVAGRLRARLPPRRRPPRRHRRPQRRAPGARHGAHHGWGPPTRRARRRHRGARPRRGGRGPGRRWGCAEMGGRHRGGPRPCRCEYISRLSLCYDLASASVDSLCKCSASYSHFRFHQRRYWFGLFCFCTKWFSSFIMQYFSSHFKLAA